MGRKKKGDLGITQDPDGNIFENDGQSLALVEVQEGEMDYPLASPESEALREKIKILTKSISQNYWELSALVYEVYSKKLFKTWGFESFIDWSNIELGIQKRKSYYLVEFQEYCNKRIKEILPAQEDQEAAIDQLKKVGWIKALEIAKENVLTKDNYAEVLEKAEAVKIDQLITELKLIKSGMTDEEKEDSNETNTMKTFRKTFIMTTTQEEIIFGAIDKAKKAINKEKTSDTIALEYICADFEANSSVDLADTLSKIERIFGCSLIAMSNDGSNILFGSDTLYSLIKETPEEELEAKVEEALEIDGASELIEQLPLELPIGDSND